MRSFALVDELAEPCGEAIGVDEVDEVAVADPFLELCVWHPSEPLALDGGDSRPKTVRHGTSS